MLFVFSQPIYKRLFQFCQNVLSGSVPVSRSKSGGSVVIELVVVTGSGVAEVFDRTVDVFGGVLVVVFTGFFVVVRNVGFLVGIFGRVVGFFVVARDVVFVFFVVTRVVIFVFFVGACVGFVVDVFGACVGFVVDVVGAGVVVISTQSGMEKSHEPLSVHDKKPSPLKAVLFSHRTSTNVPIGYFA